MKLPSKPTLAKQYRLGDLEANLSIDALVAGAFEMRTRFPVINTCAVETLERLMPKDFPVDGCDLGGVVAELERSVGKYSRRNAHAGMFAYVASPGLPTDPLGFAYASALNQNVTGYHSAPGATVVEQAVLRWMSQLAGLPATSGGLILPGGSWSNLSALAVAVHHTLGGRARDEGIRHGPLPVIIAAESAHFSIRRSAMMLGIGHGAIETIPIDSEFRMDLNALQDRVLEIQNDPSKRLCCVVATAGTTAVGAIDPLSEIAALCRQHGIWMHVDAAYGGAALLSRTLRKRLAGIEYADSITIDLHKWCYLSFDSSMLLYRNPEHARHVFSFDADYAQFTEAQRDPTFFDLSPELSRRARALPVYLAWRHYGLERLGRNVQYNAKCAHYLAQLVQASEDMEKVNNPDLSICCFRYAPPVLRRFPEKIDALNEQILRVLSDGREFLLSATRIHGRPVLRVCICSYTTEAEHMQGLVIAVRTIGEQLTGVDF